jgi:antibiotic biosynthesis monooxygenase (ABM) superfamily enzyme
VKVLTNKSLQNKSDWDNEKPTIVITPNDPEWAQAYKNWLEGKTPTNSPEWKIGVIMTYKEVSNGTSNSP